jgi:hypothetical protein
VLKAKPLTFKQANEAVTHWHRHHKPCQGCKFVLGVEQEGMLVGAAIVGRPVSREIDHTTTIEVTRLVTNGTKNACSFLYSTAARIAKELGYEKIQTYILETEPATSLKASGWIYETTTNGGTWNCNSRKGRREDQPMIKKQRWARIL